MLRFALLIVVTAVFATSGAQAAQPLQLMANTSPPYVDASLPEQGLALELVKHIYAGTDYAPQFTIEDWSQALEGARLGVALRRRAGVPVR